MQFTLSRFDVSAMFLQGVGTTMCCTPLVRVDWRKKQKSDRQTQRRPFLCHCHSKEQGTLNAFK
jgi:hypothetical protein